MRIYLCLGGNGGGGEGGGGGGGGQYLEDELYNIQVAKTDKKF